VAAAAAALTGGRAVCCHTDTLFICCHIYTGGAITIAQQGNTLWLFRCKLRAHKAVWWMTLLPTLSGCVLGCASVILDWLLRQIVQQHLRWRRRSALVMTTYRSSSNRTPVSLIVPECESTTIIVCTCTYPLPLRTGVPRLLSCLLTIHWGLARRLTSDCHEIEGNRALLVALTA
jgi:hypothetical protein